MADLADVETTFVRLASAVIYPDGPTSRSQVGVDCRIYRGWPSPAGLDADLKAGAVNVTVFPDVTSGQTLTRFTDTWQGRPVTPTLFGLVSEDTVTFSGTASVGQIAGVMLANQTFAYRTVEGDTPGSVAANLAAMIRETRIVRLSGSSIVVPGAASPVVRVVADSPVLREIRRQSHDIRFSFWCPTPSLRDIVAMAVDTALAGITFIELPDGSHGRIVYKNTVIFDQSQSAILYRRDLIYSVEYPTIVSASLPSMLFGDLLLNTAPFSV